MLLIAAQYPKEIEPLIKHLRFRKRDGYYRYKNIIAITASNREPLGLSYSMAQLVFRFNVRMAVLFGISGSLNPAFRIGEFINLEKVKLFDGSFNPVFNPLDLLKVDFLKNGVGLTSLKFNFNNDFLSLFGDCIDFESYFFVKAAHSYRILPVVVRVISDYNTKEELFSIKKKGFSYDIERLSDIMLKLSEIEHDWLKREIFSSTGITEKLNEKKMAILRGKLSFSKRQKLYKKWVIDYFRKEAQPLNVSNIFIEKEVNKSRIKINLNSRNVYEIDDYVSFFHNLKDRMGIFFANKRGELLRKTPARYTPDGGSGYSILGGYNCIYDCDYCFLKGYFRSFNPVLFLNYEDFFEEIELITSKENNAYFYLGSFFDPVALDFLTDMNENFYSFFADLKRGFLEFRTKCDRVERFLSFKPAENIIFAFSLSPDSIVSKYEHFAPALKRRLLAIKKLDMAGFKIGIRLDPFFVTSLEEYTDIFDFIDEIKNLHSVEAGFLRFDKSDYKIMLKKGYTRFLGDLSYKKGMYRCNYPYETIDFLRKRLKKIYFSMEF